jgi:hypothetical protein
MTLSRAPKAVAAWATSGLSANDGSAKQTEINAIANLIVLVMGARYPN